MKQLITLLLVFVLSACSTVKGPDVSSTEVKKAHLTLEVKALEFKLSQIKRVNAIGYRLARAIPPEDIKVKPRPYLGLFCLNRGKVTDRLYDNRHRMGVYVAFVLEGSPVETAGIKAGDLLLAINGEKISSAQSVVHKIRKLKWDETAKLTFLKDAKEEHKEVLVEKIAVDVNFSVVDEHTVNAAASKDHVFVTYGLLNFSKSDDEIAAVMGHELAHLARGHSKRKRKGSVLRNFTAVSLGITAGIFVPGIGGTVQAGVNEIGGLFGKKFSRDLEREADYFGVKIIQAAGYDPEIAATFHERFAIELPKSMISGYLHSHPSSPERTLRIRKTIEELSP